MTKFVQAFTLFCSLLHVSPTHPHHSERELDMLFSDLIARRSIVR